MKLEYISDGNEFCPLLRLFEYRPGEVDRLRDACDELAAGRITEFALHLQPWIEPIDGVGFTWRVTGNDIGVRLPEGELDFVLAFSDEAWREVADKLLPFSEGSEGYNWLTNEGEVNVLISRDGLW